MRMLGPLFLPAPLHSIGDHQHRSFTHGPLCATTKPQRYEQRVTGAEGSVKKQPSSQFSLPLDATSPGAIAHSTPPGGLLCHCAELDSEPF